MGILGGDVPPGSPNPNPSYFRPRNFLHPFPDLAFRQKLCYHYYLDWSANKKFFKSGSNSHSSLSFFVIWN